MTNRFISRAYPTKGLHRDAALAHLLGTSIPKRAPLLVRLQPGPPTKKQQTPRRKTNHVKKENETNSDKKTSERNGRPVVVTTEHRGVFFGYATPTELARTDKQIALTNARNCLYWSAAMQGFIGLANIGPDKDCKIGPVAHELTLFDVTSIVACTPGAADKWESAGFGR